MLESVILVVFSLLIFCFAFVLIYGAPFLPTLTTQINESLDLLNLEKGQTMLELGCGDGRVLIAASKRGLNVVGYELNPILAAIAWFRTRRYRRLVKIIWGDFWQQSWPPAEGIFVFILPRHMKKLNKKIIQYPHKPVSVASFAFAIPGEKPKRISKGVFLYIYTS